MTSTLHQSGTDRCAEVISKLQEHFDVVINIQGDEPYIQPEQIELLLSCFKNAATQIATLIKQSTEAAEINNPNVVKCVTATDGKALYFSRHSIPYNRNNTPPINYFKHIGIYGYRSEVLLQLSNLQQGLLEKAESLEQLRWLENGYSIYTSITELETIAIDTPEDLNKLNIFK